MHMHERVRFYMFVYWHLLTRRRVCVQCVYICCFSHAYIDSMAWNRVILPRLQMHESTHMHAYMYMHFDSSIQLHLHA